MPRRITITDKDLVISVLDSLEAFQAEGNALHHCVFQCEYYAKADSLILSAHAVGCAIRILRTMTGLSGWSMRMLLRDSHPNRHPKFLIYVPLRLPP